MVVRRPLLGFAALVGFASCGDDAGLPDARPPIDAAPVGQFAVSWSLTHGGLPQTCASVGATAVVVEIVGAGEAFGVIDSFSCGSGMGVTRDLPPKAYDLKISVAGGAGTLDGPEDLRGVVLQSAAMTAVGPVGFDVDPTGTLVFRINTAATGGNCAPTSAMGAGITATTIELRDRRGTCVPTTFAIAAGATDPAGSYASDCAGASYGCIAADQDVRAEGLIAGQHAMTITGAVAASPCWSRVSQFAVRAGGQTTTLNPQTLAYDPLVPGCPAL